MRGKKDYMKLKSSGTAGLRMDQGKSFTSTRKGEPDE